MTNNPFQPPKAEVSDGSLQGPLAGYTPAQIKKLYYRSCNVTGIAILMLLGALAMATMVLVEMRNAFPVVTLPLLIFYAFAAVGIFRRTGWGRVLGIIACTISLIGFPVGTLVGIVGLFAFIKAKELFGPDRVTHAYVKMAYKEL